MYVEFVYFVSVCKIRLHHCKKRKKHGFKNSKDDFVAEEPESSYSCRLNVDTSAFLQHDEEQIAFTRHGISFKTGLDSDVRHEWHCNEIWVVLALMLEAAMMMPVIFTNREMLSEFNSRTAVGLPLEYRAT